MRGLLFLFLALLCSCTFRNTLSVGRYKTMEEAKQNGAFLFEYSLDSAVIYDSIRIRVKNAFLQQAYYYKGYYTNEKTEVPFQWLVCTFEEDDIWPNYGFDSIDSDSSRMLVSWYIHDVRNLNKYRRHFADVHDKPDTIIWRIRECTQLRDSIWRESNRPSAVKKSRVLDSLVLIRKRPDSSID